MWAEGNSQESNLATLARLSHLRYLAFSLFFIQLPTVIPNGDRILRTIRVEERPLRQLGVADTVASVCLDGLVWARCSVAYPPEITCGTHPV